MKQSTGNRLAGEGSLYLQQHAHNPVDWFPWGQEAFDKARTEDKPIFLSIGYSSCHWCHVMERESFENRDIASRLNEGFVPIKVDREERPDVDQLYMTAAQAMIGQGGWPLSVWLTPELEPFFAGTYFPPERRFGRPGFLEVLAGISDAWRNERERVQQAADSLFDAIRRSLATDSPHRSSSPSLVSYVDSCLDRLKEQFDHDVPGFGTAPKFPRPAILDLLLCYDHLRTDGSARSMVFDTLDAMARGGIRDHVGGGFARYSVDREWIVPHFEKMLYDQGQLLASYADGFRVHNSHRFEHVIREVFDYLMTEMRSGNGLFFASEDADSDGEEGSFYVWTPDQIETALTSDQFEVVRRRFGITDGGNFEGNRSVLHIDRSIESIATELGLTPDSVKEKLESALVRLKQVRSHRNRPAKDEKIVTAWNGLIVSGLARSGGALSDDRMVSVADTAARSLLDTMIVDGRLHRRAVGSDVAHTAVLEDYAFLIQGLLDLYNVKPDNTVLQRADQLCRRCLDEFYDDDAGAFFSAVESKDVPIRLKSDHDGAEPSGNSIMVHNLIRLGSALNDQSYLNKADETLAFYAERTREYPDAMPAMARAALARLEPPVSLVVFADPLDAPGRDRMIRQVNQEFHPTLQLIVHSNQEDDTWLYGRSESIRDYRTDDGTSAAFLCKDFRCLPPVSDLRELRHELRH